MEEFEFKSKEELYKRVTPALRAKKQELTRLGYSYIKEEDIWNYLISVRWQKAHNLMLSDIVSDIIHVNNKQIDEFLKGKLEKTRRTEYFDKEFEVV